MTARTRHTDPKTSRTAAKAVKTTENQAAVMTVMRQFSRPMLDEALVQEYMARFRALRLPRQSPSGIRSRRAELAKAGRLVEGDKARMSTGRLGRTWTVAREEDS